MKKKAIIAKATGQKIKSLLQRGDRKIEIPYYFTEVPEDVYGSTINATQNMRVVDDFGKSEIELVDELHELLSIYLPEYAEEFGYQGTVYDGDEDPDEDEVVFILKPEEE